MNENVSIDLDKLKRLREEHDYSISELSEHLGYKTPTGYWLLEKGQRKISVTLLYYLSVLYDVTMEELLIIS